MGSVSSALGQWVLESCLVDHHRLAILHDLQLEDPSGIVRLHEDRDDELHGLVFFNRHQVLVNGERVDLRPTEFRLLETLVRQPDRAFTRADLMEAAVGDAFILERTIDVHIKSLRRKLGMDLCRSIRSGQDTLE